MKLIVLSLFWQKNQVWYKAEGSYVELNQTSDFEEISTLQNNQLMYSDFDNSSYVHPKNYFGVKPHKCEICHCIFASRSSLKVHLRTHTGERPYICVICDKSFRDNSNLRQHLRIHTGERPFECQICHNTFSQKATLTNHLRTHK